MAVRIKSVTITPKEVAVGQSIFISVNAYEPNWDSLKTEFPDWEQVSSRFDTWENVKNYNFLKDGD